MGFCILEVWDEWGENVTAEHHLMNLQLMDSEGSLQYATGQTDADLLKAQMDTMVEENKGPGEVSVAIILPIVLVAVVLVIVSLIAQVKVFSDCGEAGWAVFVPVYREVCLARMADKSEGLGWLCGFSNFIPFGGVIYLGLMCLFSIGIAAHYGRGFLFGLGLAILPFIFYPILAFSGK